jgi:peptide-methionine (S)-S-oxide reductase
VKADPTDKRAGAKRILLGLVACTLVATLIVVLLQQADFSPPENFPVLEPAEVEAAASATNEDQEQTATFGSGCFWCTEAIFKQVKGVRTVVSGYSGGSVENPTYTEVCMGHTGHAEAIQITFDPKVVSYPEILEVFWRSHDPTTVDQQGHDVGPQYRSVVFFHNDRQRDLAERYKQKINEAKVFSKPVVTEIEKYKEFYPAEANHQDYYARHKDQPYCQRTIGRKLEKLKAVFGDRFQAD